MISGLAPSSHIVLLTLQKTKVKTIGSIKGHGLDQRSLSPIHRLSTITHSITGTEGSGRSNGTHILRPQNMQAENGARSKWALHQSCAD